MRTKARRFDLRSGAQTSIVGLTVLWLLFISAACSNAASDRQSKLTAYERMSLGMLGASEEAALKRTLMAEKQAMISSCMAEEGFDYFPNNLDVLGVPDSGRPDLGSLAFAEQFGFGASIDPVDPETQMDDPGVAQNAAYRNTLGADAQARYDRLLEDCDLNSVPEVDGVPLAALDQRFGEATRKAQNSSRFADINSVWSACVTEFDVAEATYGALVASFLDRYETARLDPDTLASLQAEERRVAIQTFECTNAYLSSVADLVADSRS